MRHHANHQQTTQGLPAFLRNVGLPLLTLASLLGILCTQPSVSPDFIRGVLCAILVFILLAATPERSGPALHIARSVAQASDRTLQIDETFASAHEAGHVLTYAALQGPLPDLVMTMDQVSSVVQVHHIIGETWNEWRMLNALAGQAAERVLLGESSLGSATDCSQWLPLARAHCENQFGGLFYAEPRNLLEQNANDAQLSELRKRQLQRLADFFELNRGVLAELAKCLREQCRLDTEDLAPYLKRVVVPEGFPRPVL